MLMKRACIVHNRILNILGDILLIFFIFFASCTPSPLDYALDFSGSNRSELESVLEHYKDDPEKLAAAKFLIENMPAHYSYKSNEIDGYYAEVFKKKVTCQYFFIVKFMLKFTTKLTLEFLKLIVIQQKFDG